MAIDMSNPNNLDHDLATKSAIYFYRSQSGIFSFCPECAIKCEMELEWIDLAGDWDECMECDIQNVPMWYSERYDYHGDLLNPKERWQLEYTQLHPDDFE